MFRKALKEELYIFITIVTILILIFSDIALLILGSHSLSNVIIIIGLIINMLATLGCGFFFHQHDLQLMSIYRLPLFLDVCFLIFWTVRMILGL